MPSLPEMEHNELFVGFAPTLVANLVPLIGVAWYGWDVGLLVAVYAFEVVLAFPLGGVKALFAQRPPQRERESGVVSVSDSELASRRGSTKISTRLPPVFPRNIPFASNVVMFGAWAGVFLCFGLLEVLPVGESLRTTTVVVSVLSLFTGQCVDAWLDYFRSRRFEELSPYAVVELPARQAFFLMLAVVAVPAVEPAAAPLALTVIVGVKLLVEWSAHRAEHGNGGRLSGWLSGPTESDEHPDQPTVPEGRSSLTVPVERTAVLYSSVLNVLSTYAPYYVSWSLLVWLAGVVVVGGDDPSNALLAAIGLGVLALFGFMVLTDVIEGVLERGFLEYRRYGDRLVAYDTLVGELQWSASVDVLRDAELVENRYIDRKLDARRVSVTTGWGDKEATRTLGPVTDSDTLVDGFELPLLSTEFGALDYRLVAATGIASIAIVLAPIVLLATPVGSSDQLLFYLFALPFVAHVPRGLWYLARSD